MIYVLESEKRGAYILTIYEAAEGSRCQRGFRCVEPGAPVAACAILLIGAAFVVTGCSGAAGVSAEPNTAPRFTHSVRDRVFLASSATCTLTLPVATGGNGSLAYSLTPAVSGWRFDRNERTLVVPTTSAGEWGFIYGVQDADDDTSSDDADSLTFTITIAAPEGQSASRDQSISSRYKGCGNQRFFLNPEGDALDDATYTLVLDAAVANVYVIATNTTAGEVTPNIVRLDNGTEVATTRGHADGTDAVGRWAAAESTDYQQQRIAEFNNTPPRLLMDGARPVVSSAQSGMSPPPVAEGDTFTFIDSDYEHFTVTEVPATARKVVSDGAVTLVAWVADADWGSCSLCVRQEMVDALTEGFLRPGPDNDIHDWLTAIFGAPWGPHGSPYVLPAEYAEQVHVLIFDIDNDGIIEGSQTAGFYSAKDNYLKRSEVPGSNERLMFYIDAPLLADNWHPKRFLSTLAHEFQHMIHFYQKVIVHDALEEAWLNEMASEVAEDFVADKLEVDGPRGVAYDDPTGGFIPSYGRLPAYNYYNYIQATTWEFLDRYYAINYALGAYLARTYGGAPLFGDIVGNDKSGIEAIEAAIAAHGEPVLFADVLTDWAVANLLSDDTRAPHPYRYNSGTWSTSEAGGATFRLGSINLFNYRHWFGDGPNDYYDGPYLFSVSEFNDAGAQRLHSNRYADVGLRTGTVRLKVTAAAGNRITIVVKG